MIRQLVGSDFCLDRCRCCCRFSEPDSIWSPCLLDEEAGGFFRDGSLVTPQKKLRLSEFPEGSQDKLPAHIGPSFICPFLELSDNSCRIYASRPFECQLYPFLINRRQDKTFLSVDPGCLYVKENFESEEFGGYCRYLEELLSRADYKDTLRRNPQIIQSYSDARDILELKI
ncbi:YkgJ family cysteine cluster protein [Candidatus Omnitrophota bacterium]